MILKSRYCTRWRNGISRHLECYYVYFFYKTFRISSPGWRVLHTDRRLVLCVMHHVHRGTHRMRHGGMDLRWVQDDFIAWKRFPHHWPFVRGIHRSPVNSPHKRTAIWSFYNFVLSLKICQVASGFRRHFAHKTSRTTRDGCHFMVIIYELSNGASVEIGNFK